jgi:hypothetical protein
MVKTWRDLRCQYQKSLIRSRKRDLVLHGEVNMVSGRGELLRDGSSRRSPIRSSLSNLQLS